ncbi:MAG: outer membrane protein assembly factor BamB family protein [Saccharofermentanales bacterium]
MKQSKTSYDDISGRTSVRRTSGSYKKKHRHKRKGMATIITLLTVLVILIGVIVYMFATGKVFETLPDQKSSGISGVNTPTVEAEITLGELQAWENPTLKNGRFTKLLQMGEIGTALTPAANKVISDVFSGSDIIANYTRPYDISFFDPITYQKIPGVLTFRGNSFRNSPSYGFTTMKDHLVEQIWERQVGGLKSSRWDFSWSGTGWTGQPIIVRWPDDVKNMMNIYASKKAKSDLVEVISATMDGNIYFYDLEDGKATRPPINIKVPIKGTPAIDPRGYPILYVGQGDYAAPGKEKQPMGMRIFNLIDQSMLYLINGDDKMAFRTDWGACDSSPVIDAKSDTLIWGSENGVIYTAKLNTIFDKETKKVTINPVFANLRYKAATTSLLGIECSPSFYGQYMYFSDNSGTLSCIDLKTMKHAWIKQLDDDTDVTPVISVEEGGVYIYIGTEVDFQRKFTGNYVGDAYIYKIDAMTGETIWRNSYKCWTKNDEKNVGNDINGGVIGTPVVGKNNINNLVAFSFCMTNGIYSGNTLAAFDKETGELIWSYKSSYYGWSSPVDIYDKNGNAYLIFPDSQSNMYILDGQTGAELSVGKITMAGGEGGTVESSAAIYNDTLVIGTRRGVIAGFKLK